MLLLIQEVIGGTVRIERGECSICYLKCNKAGRPRPPPIFIRQKKINLLGKVKHCRVEMGSKYIQNSIFARFLKYLL